MWGEKFSPVAKLRAVKNNRWQITTEQETYEIEVKEDWEFCSACERYFQGPETRVGKWGDTWCIPCYDDWKEAYWQPSDDEFEYLLIVKVNRRIKDTTIARYQKNVEFWQEKLDKDEWGDEYSFTKEYAKKAFTKWQKQLKEVILINKQAK